MTSADRSPPPVVNKRAQLPKCKVVFLGAAGVGKTSIINRFMYETFTRDYEVTVGIDYFTKTISVDGKMISLQIWDTAGQEQFQSLIPTYIRGAELAVIVYDLSDPKTLEAAKVWHRKVMDARGDTAFCILVGNKCDLQSKIDESEIREVAQKLKMLSLEVSAKTGQAIRDLFSMVVEETGRIDLNRNSVNVLAEPVVLTVDSAKQSRPCC
jgi:small GTP-binding protein